MTRLLSQPTSPGRESWVQQEVHRLTTYHSIASFQDGFGNIWLNAASFNDVKAADMVLSSHMDHPGLSVNSFFEDSRLVHADCKWLGGGPKLNVGQKVKLFSNVAYSLVLNGSIVTSSIKDGNPDNVLVEIEGIQNITPEFLHSFGPWGGYLVYPNKPESIAKTSSTVSAHALDDLAGAAIIISALQSVGHTHVVGLLTRSEESGLVGAHQEASSKILKQGCKIVTVEAAKATDDVSFGSGVVIRKGDVEAAYDLDLYKELVSIAKQSKCNYQAQRKAKGATDAAAFKHARVKIGGIGAIVKNYHDEVGLAKLAPEKMSTKDVEAMHALVVKIMEKYR